MQLVGHIAGIFRYPVKSMRGEAVASAQLGWHGVEGDRRFAFRRLEDRSSFPWLTAGKLANLLLYWPQAADGDTSGRPTHVRIPDGSLLPIDSEDLATHVGHAHGSPVQISQLKDGIFDDASVSVIASETSDEIARIAGVAADVRRYRPNIVVRLAQPAPFQEDQWLGGVLAFGEDANAATIAVTRRDVRCAMINLDPDTAASSPDVLKAVVRTNDTTAGIYATVTRTGTLTVGQPIYFRTGA